MLDLTPETESRVQEYAAREGVSTEEAINRLLKFTVRTGKLSMENNLPEPTPENVTATDNPVLQLLLEQLHQAEKATPEEIREAEVQWQTFREAINDTRRTNEERPIYKESVPR